ncbi:MAG: hypothetical protein ACKPKO_16055 [Candidatus Fonsibacter sp.]
MFLLFYIAIKPFLYIVYINSFINLSCICKCIFQTTKSRRIIINLYNYAIYVYT